MARLRNTTLHVSAVTATGSTQANSTVIGTKSMGMVAVSGANAAKGVVLPAASAGKIYFIKNLDAAELEVWPAVGDGINAIAVNTQIAMAASTAAVFIAKDSTTWETFSLLPS